MDQHLVTTSKFLSYVLRHNPSAIGVDLDPAGWLDIDTLLTAAQTHGRRLSRADLHRVVAENDKRRFEVRGNRIRAAQGHSVNVDLDLAAVEPPDRLYHGTATRFLDAILAEGLKPMRRSHVHLSADPATARTVGTRHGRPVVLTVDSAGMHRDGHTFHRAANGVWLTRHVPPTWLQR
jgi:putative RNA 2'-phosphotransferase